MKFVIAFFCLALLLLGGFWILGPMGPKETSETADPDTLAQNEEEVPNRLDSNNKKLNDLLDKDSKSRVTSDITARIPQVDSGEAEEVRKMVLDANDSPYVRNEGIDLLRRSGDPELPNTLVKVLEDENQSSLMRDFSVQHLFVSAKKADPHTRKQITEKIVNALNDKDELVRREAFLALTRLKHDKPREIILSHMDSNEYKFMRDLMIRGAQKYDIKEVLPSVRKYMEDPYDVVSVAAMSALSNWGDQESMAKMIEISEDQSLKARVRNVAKASIEKLKKKSS